MVWIDETLWCDGCGAEISLAPILVGRRHFCCQDCSQGYECDCAKRMEVDVDSPRAGSAFPSGPAEEFD